MQSKKFFIWGAKGHALVLAEIIHLNGDKIIAIADKDSNAESPIEGLDVIIGYQGYSKWLDEIKSQMNLDEISAISAIGGNRGKDRVDYLEIFQRDGLRTPTLIHPKAYISKGATIGDNSQICAFALIGVNVKIGSACILNTKASIDHESKLGNGIHLAPGATVCGNVTIGDYTLIGAGATVLPHLKIGKNCTIGAGAVVTKSLADNSKVIGVPAKPYY
jgi:sugar O-acyltransferase (sialic acid O-acetyltransferase NeuD family)